MERFRSRYGCREERDVSTDDGVFVRMVPNRKNGKRTKTVVTPVVYDSNGCYYALPRGDDMFMKELRQLARASAFWYVCQKSPGLDLVRMTRPWFIVESEDQRLQLLGLGSWFINLRSVRAFFSDAIMDVAITADQKRHLVALDVWMTLEEAEKWVALLRLTGFPLACVNVSVDKVLVPYCDPAWAVFTDDHRMMFPFFASERGKEPRYTDWKLCSEKLTEELRKMESRAALGNVPRGVNPERMMLNMYDASLPSLPTARILFTSDNTEEQYTFVHYMNQFFADVPSMECVLVKHIDTISRNVCLAHYRRREIGRTFDNWNKMLPVGPKQKPTLFYLLKEYLKHHDHVQYAGLDYLPGQPTVLKHTEHVVQHLPLPDGDYNLQSFTQEGYARHKDDTEQLYFLNTYCEPLFYKRTRLIETAKLQAQFTLSDERELLYFLAGEYVPDDIPDDKLYNKFKRRYTHVFTERIRSADEKKDDNAKNVVTMTEGPRLQLAAVLFHLYVVLCGRDFKLFRILLCCLRSLLFDPGRKLGYLMVLRGDQGTGKTALFRAIGNWLFGLGSLFHVRIPPSP